MFGLQGTLMAGGLGLMASLALGFLWKSEQAAHERTRVELAGEKLRADTATKAAADNALKVAEMEKEIAVEAERQKFRAQENARILAEKDQQLQKTRQRMGAWKNAIEKRPQVAERAMRAELNRRLRELAAITCRTDCEGGDSGKNSEPAKAP